MAFSTNFSRQIPTDHHCHRFSGFCTHIADVTIQESIPKSSDHWKRRSSLQKNERLGRQSHSINISREVSSASAVGTCLAEPRSSPSGQWRWLLRVVFRISWMLDAWQCAAANMIPVSIAMEGITKPLEECRDRWRLSYRGMSVQSKNKQAARPSDIQ